MKQKWFIKSLKEVQKIVGDTRIIVEELKEAQEEKLSNYPGKFNGTPNYQLSELRLEKLEEIMEVIETLDNLIVDFE